jgi:hypothetical protein
VIDPVQLGLGQSMTPSDGSTCAICDFLRREDELVTELMNHKRSTSY